MLTIWRRHPPSADEGEAQDESVGTAILGDRQLFQRNALPLNDRCLFDEQLAGQYHFAGFEPGGFPYLFVHGQAAFFRERVVGNIGPARKNSQFGEGVFQARQPAGDSLAAVDVE